MHIVEKHWNKYYGHDAICQSCNSFDADTHTCQVLDGGNRIIWCDVLVDFVHTNDIDYKGII